MNVVSHDGNIVADLTNFRILQLEAVQRVRRVLQHVRQRLPIETPDSLRSGHDALLIGETHRRVDVFFLDRLPILILQIEQFSAQRRVRHDQSSNRIEDEQNTCREMDWTDLIKSALTIHPSCKNRSCVSCADSSSASIAAIACSSWGRMSPCARPIAVRSMSSS